MKTATTALRTLIESGRFFKADLYTITLIDGTILRYTSADVLIQWGGNSFTVLNLDRDFVKVSLGFTVDQMKLSVYPKAADLIEGLSFGAALRAGLLDGAKVLMQKAYWPIPAAGALPPSSSASPPVTGVLHGFFGSISDSDGARTDFTITVKSALELLNITMPREVYQTTCLHMVYDPGCTLSRAAFTVTGSVTGSGTQNSFASARGEASGYFDQGVLFFTSGANSGARRTIKSFSGGVFTFVLPLPIAPSTGDNFSAYPGCDRTQATCGAKFSNTAHFKGYPYIPVPETAL